MPAPANDLVANAQLISGTSGSIGPYTVDEATHTDTEDSSQGEFQTIWFKWVAPQAGRLHLTTQGSIAGDAGSGDGLPVGAFGNLDTRLNFWHGTTPGSLTWVKENDDSESDPDGAYYSEMRVTVVSGETYFIQLGTYDTPYTGTALLTWDMSSTAAPSNDDVADALAISAGYGDRSGCSSFLPVDNASLETGEQAITGATHDVNMNQTLWWRWVADSSGTQNFTANEATFAWDARILVYLSPDGSSDFSQFQEIVYSAFGGVGFNAVFGQTYYIQIGTSGGLEGDVQLCWNFGIGTQQVGECPTFVGVPAEGSRGDVGYPSLDNTQPDGVFAHDGYIETWMPTFVELGNFLLLVLVCEPAGAVSTGPPGWTSLGSETISGPKPTTNIGPNQHGQSPYDWDDVSVAWFWKIADADDVAAEGDMFYTFEGLDYTQNGNPPGQVGGTQVFAFGCFDAGDFHTVPFPDPPVKYIGIDKRSAELIDGQIYPAFPTENSSPTVAHEVTYPTSVADWIGNHMYLAEATLQVWEWNNVQDYPEDVFPNTDMVLMNSGSFVKGSFERFAWEGVRSWSFRSRDGFSDEVHMTDTYDYGTSRVYSNTSSWSDGFLNPPGFATYAVLPAIGGSSLIVQAPESFFPTNDTPEGAYEFPDCPAKLIQCNFAALTEGDYPVLGFTPYNDLWYKFTLAEDETITISTTGSDTNTILGLYDSSLTLIEGDDDDGPGTASLITRALTGGELYYVQVISKFEDDWGTFHITLDCTGGLLKEIADYWGVLVGAM